MRKPKVRSHPSSSSSYYSENRVYQSTPYRGTDRIISQTFPELTLTVEQVLNA
ncbi:MAG: hypothetical protein AB1589_10520 [Cyanobacteriota bacterium]